MIRSKFVAIGLVSILAACGAVTDLTGVKVCSHYDDSPIPPGYDENGCWSPPEYFERAPEVIPDVDDAAPVLRIEARGNAPTGMEGTLYFVRVVSPSGRVVLEREWDWPGMDQQVPPGAYQVTAYSRTCDGNCGSLDPATLSCTVDILAEPSMSYTVTYHVTGDGTISCAAPLSES
ncbi:MAG TPA: hypothetical protein VFW95_05785 [Candidatus Limnocylindria bacterium]|nr:hypothetical protein [Candidatus Limnocylindria bacterium]